MKPGIALLLLALGASSPAAQAQTGKWPDKPVRTVVPMVAGGNGDITARLIAARLSDEFGQQFIIDNRPGAGGSIGAGIVVHANPDGYTMIVMSSSYAANAALYKLPYDPIRDIAPIGLISVVPFILAVNPSVQAMNLKDFIELARAKPGTLNVGSPGTGSTPHLAAELFQQMTNTKMIHIPYKGDNPAIADLIAGQIQLLFATGLVLTPQINAGKLRGLAVTTEKRSPANPDLPAIGELVPGYAVDGWTGMWAPAGTPKTVIAKLNQALARILKQPDVQERLRAGGAQPTPCTPDEYARLISRDIAKWTKVVKTGNIKIN
jgi:tripartite-type tricarboxylate transporter receptor subunit TctC